MIGVSNLAVCCLQQMYIAFFMKTLIGAVAVIIDAAQETLLCKICATEGLAGHLGGGRLGEMQPIQQSSYFTAHQDAARLAWKLRMGGQGDRVHGYETALLIE